MWGPFRDAVPSPSSFPYSISFSLSHAFFPSSLFHVPLSASVCYYPLIIFLIRLFFVKKEQCLSDVKSPFTFLRKQRRCCAFTISLSAEDSPPPLPRTRIQLVCTVSRARKQLPSVYLRLSEACPSGGAEPCGGLRVVARRR